MLITLDSFWTLLRSMSPCLIHDWYCPFLQSGLLVTTIPPTCDNVRLIMFWYPVMYSPCQSWREVVPQQWTCTARCPCTPPSLRMPPPCRPGWGSCRTPAAGRKPWSWLLWRNICSGETCICQPSVAAQPCPAPAVIDISHSTASRLFYEEYLEEVCILTVV